MSETQQKQLNESVTQKLTSVSEAKTQEDLDTEVSQINTQEKETQETYSRPMSRTSSATPVNIK